MVDHPAALLLTGGASRRLGRDKATLPIGATTLSERTATLLREVARPVIEVGPGYTSLVHVREEPVGQGPLAAMAAGWAELTRAEEPGRVGVLVVATDLPGLTIGLLRLLAGHPARGCLVPLDVAGHPQLLCARYPPVALARAGRLVEQGRRAVGALLDGEEVTWLAPREWVAAAGSPGALADVDTPADLASLPGWEAAGLACLPGWEAAAGQ